MIADLAFLLLTVAVAMILPVLVALAMGERL